MTAPNFGACCASGDVRRDPWTGDERCQHCGLPVPLPNVAGAALHGAESPEAPADRGARLAKSMDRFTVEDVDRMLAYSRTLPDEPDDEPPAILGGQGRDASEIEADAVGIAWVIAVVWIIGAILIVVAWAAGGGR